MKCRWDVVLYAVALAVPVGVVLTRVPGVLRDVAGDAKLLCGPPSGTPSVEDARKQTAIVEKLKMMSAEERKRWLVYHTYEVQVPEDAVSAKYANIELGTAWSLTFEARNQSIVRWPDWGTGIPSPDSPITSMVASCLGGTATLVFTGQQFTGAAQTAQEGERPIGAPESVNWYGHYHEATLTITAPSEGETPPDEDSATYAVWAGDGWDDPNPAPEGTTMATGDLEIAIASTLTGMYPKGVREDNGNAAADDRNQMDYTDFNGQLKWYADESAEVTISAGGMSVSGPLADAGGEVEIGNTWALTMQFTIAEYPSDSTVYAAFSDVTFNGIAVDLSNLDLYNPGTGTAPDGDQPNWKRAAPSSGGCARITDDGGIATWWTGTGNTSASWSGRVWAPFYGTFVPVEGAHEDGTAYTFSTMVYRGPIIEWYWDDDTSSYLSRYVEWTGNKTYYQQQKSWEFTHEWQTLASTTECGVYQEADWLAASGDKLGDGTPSQVDVQLGMLMQWLDAASLAQQPWDGPIATLAHAASTDVDIPPGLASRPSAWTGSGGVTVNPADNAEWTVANGSTAPKVARSFATRRYLRWNRLAGGSWISGAEYGNDWTIIGKANVAIGTTEDDPDWWSASTGGVDAEDVTQWRDYSYLLLSITAPAAGTVTITVHYTVPAFSDPWYTCAEHRWSEYDYTTTIKTATFTKTVAAGANALLVDLACPNEGYLPTYTNRMEVVDSVEIGLPANSSGSPQVWTLTGLALVHDPGDGERAEPDGHILLRYKRAWDWISADWCGLIAVIDGKDALEVDYGYGGTYGYTRAEHKLLYIQRSEHCPDSEATSRIDTLKTIARLVGEVNLQEAWTATDHGVLETAMCKDADDAYLITGPFWFDLRHNREWEGTSSIAMDGAPCVGTMDLLAGIEQHHYYYNVPRGRGHTLVKNSAGTERQRNLAVAGTLYRRPDTGGTWTSIEDRPSNDHARMWSSPLPEPGYEYRWNDGDAFSVVTREYSTSESEYDDLTPIHPHLAEGYITDLHYWFVSDGNVYHKRKPTARAGWTSPVAIASGFYPCGHVLPHGELLLSYQTPASQTAWVRSLDAGGTWEATGVARDGLYPASYVYNGIEYLVTYTSGVGQVIRRSQNRFSTLLTYGSATSALITAESNAERVAFMKRGSAGRTLECVVPSGSKSRFWYSKDDGETWVEA